MANQYNPESNPNVSTESAGSGHEQPEMAMENTVESAPATETAYESAETAPQSKEGVLANIVGAVQEGAEDAKETVGNFIPALGEIIHKGVYSSFYTLSYGVVFGALVVGSLIPSNNAMGEGVRDGFEAARRAFKARKESPGTDETLAEEGLTPA